MRVVASLRAFFIFAAGVLCFVNAARLHSQESKRIGRPAASTEGWQAKHGTEEINGTPFEFAETSVTGSDGLKFDVQARCYFSDGMLAIGISPISNRIHFQRSPVPQSFKFFGSGEYPQSCAHMDVSIGQNQPQSFYSPTCDRDDYVRIAFLGNLAAMTGSMQRLGRSAIQQTVPSLQSDPKLGTAPEWNWVFRWIGGIDTQIISDMGVSLSMKQLFSANTLNVRLPLVNHPPSVVHINLDDGRFRQFASTCAPPPGEAVRPGTPTPESQRNEALAGHQRHVQQLQDMLNRCKVKFQARDYDGAITQCGKAMSMDRGDDPDFPDDPNIKAFRDEVLALSQQAQAALKGNAPMASTTSGSSTSGSSPQPEDIPSLRAGEVSERAALPYFTTGQRLAQQATVNPVTGKITLPPGCAESLRKYLKMAPNGIHAAAAKAILSSAGLNVQ